MLVVPATACHAGHKEREYEAILRRTLEGLLLRGLHPRTCVSVVLQVRSCSAIHDGMQHVGAG